MKYLYIATFILSAAMLSFLFLLFTEPRDPSAGVATKKELLFAVLLLSAPVVLLVWSLYNLL